MPRERAKMKYYIGYQRSCLKRDGVKYAAIHVSIYTCYYVTGDEDSSQNVLLHAFHYVSIKGKAVFYS